MVNYFAAEWHHPNIYQFEPFDLKEIAAWWRHKKSFLFIKIEYIAVMMMMMVFAFAFRVRGFVKPPGNT